jgi:hypothetical protein
VKPPERKSRAGLPAKSKLERASPWMNLPIASPAFSPAVHDPLHRVRAARHLGEPLVDRHGGEVDGVELAEHLERGAGRGRAPHRPVEAHGPPARERDELGVARAEIEGGEVALVHERESAAAQGDEIVFEPRRPNANENPRALTSRDGTRRTLLSPVSNTLHHELPASPKSMLTPAP